MQVSEQDMHALIVVELLKNYPDVHEKIYKDLCFDPNMPEGEIVETLIYVRDCLENGSKIQAVKAVREKTSCGLYQAKIFVENIKPPNPDVLVKEAPFAPEFLELMDYYEEMMPEYFV